MLADDSVTAQNMGRKILADAGYEVLTVNNGSAALKKIADAKPELIVLDVYMPGYSGLEVCQRLKDSPETARIPVLLTVGKLEPFKPEEAKRVRADGFIVKPFEASELLSALSKLEDKIVPRSESSKPGRFARANAAIEEGRYDKTVAIDEDAGWKNRIAFPKKKKTEEEPAAEDPAVYNAVNKDLKTVVDQKTAAHPYVEKAAEEKEEKVDLGALAPEGLPKDVTPEEIAALAAAAAQVKGKLIESKPEEAPQAEVESHSKSAEPVEAKSEPVAEPVAAEAKTEAVKETEPPIAETKAQEPVEAVAKSEEAAADPAPTPADVMAAIVAVEKDSGSSLSPSPNNGSGSPITADEPVTMAVAAEAERVSVPAASRWAAVAVALAQDEAGLSLEQEMQKAQAAAVSAEAAHADPIAPVIEKESEPTPVAAEPQTESTSPIEAAQPTVNLEPEVATAAVAVGNAATEAMSAAVKELEAVAAAYEAERTVSSIPETQTPETQTSEVTESSAVAASAEAVEAKAQENLTSSPEPEVPTVSADETTAAQTAIQDSNEETKSEIPEPEKEDFEKIEPAVVAQESETPAPAAEAETPQTQSAPEVAEDPTEPAVTGPSIAGGLTDMARREKEIAESTAAAWASWRRIRETDGKGHSTNLEKDEAAMAVAAGAEKSPEDANSPEPESEELTSIVDSVLADLRPKIVEEISRKLGKKK